MDTIERVVIACPKCKQKLRCEAGGAGTCPKCGTHVTFPDSIYQADPELNRFELERIYKEKADVYKRQVLVPSDAQDPSGYSKEMAELILEEFEELGLRNRGDKDGSGMRVLRGASENDVPGVLTEFCFLDTDDIAFVSTTEGRKAEAVALYRAIMAFFQDHAY